MSLIDDIIERSAQAAFGRPIITNTLRGLVAEAIIAAALEPEWTWCAADYASWDFERADGKRLEVKQSAARQSWSTDTPSRCSFDIAPRKGRWENEGWVDEPGRAADLYVLAHHPMFDDSADHRDPMQWRFYVIASDRLPDTKRISHSRASRLTDAVGFEELRSGVQAIAARE